MDVKITKQEMRSFEQSVSDDFADKKIRAPIHLNSGSEKVLINIFQKCINEDDWILCQWRSHYECLLKGVPQDELRAAIHAGKSISLCFPKYKILSSAIAGGNIPIALGIAKAIKLRGGSNKAVCFIGDMGSEMGIAHECIKYAEAFNLPFLAVVADNEKSVCTPTRDAWGKIKLTYEKEQNQSEKVIYYNYSLPWPHSGGLTRVNF